MNINTKRGFLSLEAALLLPVFIVGILTFGFLIKVIAAEANIIHAMADEGGKLSVRAYSMRIAPDFGMTLKKRLAAENSGIEDIHVETFQYLYRAQGKDDLIALRVSAQMKVKLPIVLYDGFELSETLLFRGFTGRERIPERIRFDEMEMEEESHIVWVFPTAGTKYHEETCRYIRVEARQGFLDARIQSQYKACALCRPDESSRGSVIYYFQSSGEAYHKGDCYIVDRYVISMEEADAVKKGYTPCMVCQ